MEKKVEAYMRAHGMLPYGCQVVVGLSGGGDSMALFYLLNRLKETFGVSLWAVHVHHGLRGEEADRDAALVERICREEEVPLELLHYSVREIARERKLGLEEAGRLVRREAFERKACELSREAPDRPVRIALAHHANDLAETMLHHMARGTGLRGLGAMKPVQGRLIRPFLCLERREIEQYLEEKNIPYETDSTNLQDTYTRNRIRHQIVGKLCEEINPKAVVHMAELSLIAGQADTYLTLESQKLQGKYVRTKENGIFLKETFAEEAEILQVYLVRGILRELAGGEKDLGAEHFRMVRELLEHQSGHRISLPYDLLVSRTYEGLLFSKDRQREKLQEQEFIPPETLVLHKGLLESKIFLNLGQKILEKKYTKWFDYDKIKGRLSVRSRRQGDYLIINAQGSRKKLNRYFIDERIPGEERDQIPLVACGPEILWVIGGRMGENYKITEHTKRILELNYKGGEEDE